jgi:hypothetical protein
MFGKSMQQDNGYSAPGPCLHNMQMDPVGINEILFKFHK